MDAIEETNEIIQLYSDEENEDIEAEINTQIDNIEKIYLPLKTKTLLNKKYDQNDCYLTIHSEIGRAHV